jgi:hypothetical protein
MSAENISLASFKTLSSKEQSSIEIIGENDIFTFISQMILLIKRRLYV